MKIAGHHEKASPNNKKRTTGDTGDKGFFAVDVRCFTHACTDVNKAAAYLVMACGTGFDHISTAWSVNAIEARTGISRTRAKAAIDGLIKDRLVSRVKGTKSRYKLATWAQFIVRPKAADESPNRNARHHPGGRLTDGQANPDFPRS